MKKGLFVKLKKLLAGLPVEVKGRSDIDITGICNHSKRVSPGSLFIAKKGSDFDGTLYIGDAKKFGAVAVLTDLYNPFIKGIVQVVTSDITYVEAIMAQRYYSHPTSKMWVAGITGTNGKTTTTHIARHLLNEDNSAALIGTIERSFLDCSERSKLTTPDSIDVQKYLNDIFAKGAKSVVMEVTSHGLCQNRVAGIDFDVALFTNLSPDHLDYHGSMENYFKAKKTFFCSSKASAKKQVVNIDDPWGVRLVKECALEDVLTLAIDSGAADLRAVNIEMGLDGISFEMIYRGTSVQCHLPMLGKFNIYNALAASALALIKGMELDQIAQRLKSFGGIPGRMEWIKFAAPYHICVDFAHTEEALKQTLAALSQVKKKRIITLFGCGGDRDPSKRKTMAQVAEAFSDLVVITSDNARSEDPDLILDTIAKGFSTKASFVKMKQRKEAIAFAIDSAKAGDIILIAGRGHEQHLNIGGELLPFDDKQVALELLKQSKKRVRKV
ncbi:UDP-N-acetylmuramoyl-L-alanyl-D-glutamate--2,6-diaminopimelate ligase [Candidatus Aerophobetes bacterium]|uniref:UDP-N-acetylmuramyl-tripeptide synthetase n=1 Tax=Aerophobetes bacterium TaxID=2030807 RepID=A0A2A4X6N5_UNCAE|nr:MAG: UDP-N-acetylmuramoyl-L-alanyl-D-glutamate--2,6-diaminopimelate ligase [Candidatus Aerophobetes bacterium]